MSGLTQNDIKVLDFYARQGNRVLYWNYLAHKEGVDGYPALAMSVVRNDNIPGSVANHYAANIAKEVNGKSLTERQWEAVGVDLMRIDLDCRKALVNASRPDLALNLPASVVEAVHDETFSKWGITSKAWTPKILFEASRTEFGKGAEQEVWNFMLDNRSLGLSRGLTTSVLIAKVDEHIPEKYFQRLAVADLAATNDPSYEKYDQIGNVRLGKVGGQAVWYEGAINAAKVITDPAKISELNDAYAVRVERLNMYKDYDGKRNTHRHRDDHYPILESKFYFSQNEAVMPVETFARNDLNKIQVKESKTNLTDDIFSSIMNAHISNDPVKLKAAQVDAFNSDLAQNTYAEVRQQNIATETQLAEQQRQAELERQQTVAMEATVRTM